MLSLHPAAPPGPLAFDSLPDAADPAPLKPAPRRLPPGVAAPIIVALSLGLWGLIWKAGQYVAGLLG
jgi:hypothetical protein